MNIERIQSFKNLYQTRFGEMLSDEEATRKAVKLQSLFNLIYGERFGLTKKTEDISSGENYDGKSNSKN